MAHVCIQRLSFEAEQKAPLGELVDIIDVGFACAYLAMPFARRHRSLRNTHGWERFFPTDEERIIIIIRHTTTVLARESVRST
jgi:hypothetical protein